MASYDTCVCSEPKQKRSKSCKACDKGQTPKESPTNTTKVEGDRAEVNRRTRESVETLADLVRVCKIDTAEWEIERWIANAWGNGWFQVKAWLKRKVAVVNARAEIALMVADAKKHIAPRMRIVKASSRPTGLLAEPQIPDLHLGKLAWAKETGWEDYDSAIAVRLYEEALEALLDRIASFRCDSVLFPVGSDFFHSDSKAGTTTAGTPLDNDSRFPKMFTEGRRLMTRAIDRLRLLGHVNVKVVPGNHDAVASFCLGEALECWFHSTSGVTIDNAPTARKYYEHGKVMLMLTHGNKGKLQDYPLLMAAEQSEMWGRTTFKEAHTGDKHQTRVQEFKGVKVRISPALCAADAWHSEMTFVGQGRSAEAFVFDKTEGLVGTSYYTVNVERERKAA